MALPSQGVDVIDLHRPPALELVGVVLVACSAVLLIGWRRFPLGVFAVTAAAGVLLAGLGCRESPRGMSRLDPMGTGRFPQRGVSPPPRPP